MRSPSTPASELALWQDPPAAPEWLVGLWRRESIRFPDGSKDDTTRVYWGQTRRLYVDLRIPANRPNADGRGSFDDFSLSELRLLAEQKGFAGHITMADGLCSWVRYIDYRPDTGRSDAGRLRLEGDTLYEEGDPTSILASAYQEIYQRERGATRLCAALRLVAHQPAPSAGPDATGAVLIMIDDRFLFARPRQQPLPPAETLRELVEAAGNDRTLIHAYLDCEISLGGLAGSYRPWTIAASTLPFREGTRLWRQGSARLSDNGQLLIQETDRGRFEWRPVESTLPGKDLVSLINE
jgi:hypothetical protein